MGAAGRERATATTRAGREHRAISPGPLTDKNLAPVSSPQRLTERNTTTKLNELDSDTEDEETIFELLQDTERDTHMAQNSELPLEDLLQSLLSYSSQLQDFLDKKRLGMTKT